MVVGSVSPPPKESDGAEHNKMVVREQHDHTPHESYEYQHIQASNRISLSSTMVLNNHYGDLLRKVQQSVEWNRLLKILDEN